MDAFSAAKAKMGAKSGGEAAAAAAVGLAAPQPAAPAPGPAGPGSPCEPAAYKLEDLETLATVGECGRAARRRRTKELPRCLPACGRAAGTAPRCPPAGRWGPLRGGGVRVAAVGWPAGALGTPPRPLSDAGSRGCRRPCRGVRLPGAGFGGKGRLQPASASLSEAARGRQQGGVNACGNTRAFRQPRWCSVRYLPQHLPGVPGFVRLRTWSEGLPAQEGASRRELRGRAVFSHTGGLFL